jgi:hypothetical protein
VHEIVLRPVVRVNERMNFQELMAAVTGAIWKCASSPDNVDRFQDLGLIPILIKILKENSDALDDLQFNPLKVSVLTNVVGAISGSRCKHF